MAEETTPCFCFGSNGLKQLKERVESDDLVASPAVVPGYVRVYSGLSARWDNGAVASIVECEGGFCLGSVVDLTKSQMETLDGFEGIMQGADPFGMGGWYRRQWVTHHTTMEEAKNKKNEKKAIAYVMNGREWRDGPSDKYLNACHRNISQFWSCHDVCDTFGAKTPRERDVFRLPVLNLDKVLFRIWSPYNQIDSIFLYNKQTINNKTTNTTIGKTTEIQEKDSNYFLIDERKTKQTQKEKQKQNQKQNQKQKQKEKEKQKKEKEEKVTGELHHLPKNREEFLKKMDKKLGRDLVRSVVWVEKEGGEGEGVYAWCYHGRSC